MARSPDSDTSRLDDAARAGWLYYIAGNTQDEIARKLGVSRQTAQRLVSLAVSERLIKVRLDHPIAPCLELSRQAQEPLRPRFLRGRAQRSGLDIEHARRRRGGRGGDRALSRRRSIRSIVAMGTGRTLRAVGRAAAADGLPAAQGRLAGRQYRARRLGLALRCHHAASATAVQRAALSDAAAGHRHDRAREVDCSWRRSPCAMSSSSRARPMSPSSASAPSATTRHCCSDGFVTPRRDARPAARPARSARSSAGP